MNTNIKLIKNNLIKNITNFNNINISKNYFPKIKFNNITFLKGDFIKIDLINFSNKKYKLQSFEGSIIKVYNNKFYKYIFINLLKNKQLYGKLFININSPKIFNITKLK